MRDDLLTKLLSAAAIIVAAAHAYAAFFPSATNWGFHHLAFFSSTVRIALLFLMVLLLVPAFQRSILRWCEKLLGQAVRLRRFTKSILMLLAIVLGVALFWLARERLTFLGDGSLVVRNLASMERVDLIPTLSFYDAPFSTVIVYECSKFLLGIDPAFAAENSFRFVSVAFGAGWILLLFWVSRLLTEEKLERALVFVFLLGSAGIELFFGYVEIYTPAAFMFLLFMACALSHLRKRLSLIVPSMVFGALLTTHFGMMVFLPAVGWLFYVNLRARRIGRVVVACLAMICTFALLMLTSGYTAGEFLDVVLKSGSHRVPLSFPEPGTHAYTLFSLYHFSEVINLLLLISPLAFVLLLFVVILKFKNIRWMDHEWLFVMLSVASGLVFIFLMNPELGMSRDWDVFSLFTAAVLVGAAMACLKYVGSQTVRRRVLVIASLIGVLHTIPWIALNATEEQALARFGVLQDSRFWGTTAVINSYDELAAFYHARNDLPRSREFYNKFIAVDSGNGRILANCAIICQELHDDSSAIRYFEQAIRHNTIVKTSYTDLGKLYAKYNRLQEAIAVARKGLTMGDNSSDALNSLGVYIVQLKPDYDEGLEYFLRAIDLDSTYSNAFLNAGFCFYYLGKQDEMKAFFSKFLELEPGYADAENVRRLIDGQK